MIIKNSLALKSALILLFLVLILQACGPEKPGIYKNEQIPNGVRNKLHQLNAELLPALKANDPEQQELLMAKELIDDKGERLKTAEHISNCMKEADYSLMSEYYIVSQLVKRPGHDDAEFIGPSKINERGLGINNFDLSIYRQAQEMYMALFVPKLAMQKWLVTVVYCKYNYGWKVSRMELGPYAENGLTAPQLMQKAKEQLKNNYWLDASNTASFAVNCLRPSQYWKYVNEQAIYKFNGDALTNVMAHYKLPLMIKEVPTHPRLWRVRVERTPEGAFPNLNYISSINLLDTMALKKENEAIGKVIGHVINGLDKDKKYIYYTIYNETKKGIPFRDHYDLRQKL